MSEAEPNLVVSSLSRRVTWTGYALRVEIYRLEHDATGSVSRHYHATSTLEVVNESGTSIVWDDPFSSDKDADAAFRDALAREGIQALLDDDNKVIPFPRPRH